MSGHRDIRRMRKAVGLLVAGSGVFAWSMYGYLFGGVVSGIGDYGNCFGVPTVWTDVRFDPCYDGNILVNAFALGVVKTDGVFLDQLCYDAVDYALEADNVGLAAEIVTANLGSVLGAGQINRLRAWFTPPRRAPSGVSSFW